MVKRAAVTLAALLAAVTPAFSNGAVSERKAGGLVFKKSDTIGIASEELFVSRDQIRVSYVYSSAAKTAQSVTISFPMPDVPLDDGPDTEDAFMNEKFPDKQNYMNFKVRVDGQDIKPRPVERALFKGKDVTARLMRDGVPLLLAAHLQDKIGALPEPVTQALVKEGLLNRDENSRFYTVNWSYQVLFEWEQTFKPGQTKVDIAYRPIAGDSSDFGDYYDKGAGVKRYCVDSALRATLQKNRGRYEVVKVGYVLKTAQFWKGPIGAFRLVVDKARPNDLVAFCPANSNKIAPTQFEWKAANFLPDRDLQVVFFVKNEQLPE